MYEINIKNLLSLMRPYQYVKNLFIFAPLFFSFDSSLETIDILKSLYSFTIFSILASSIYILNDLMDIEEDKKHPKKRLRPLASEKVSKSGAKILFFILSLVALVLSLLLNINLFAVLFIYFILNIAYSLKLKHIAVIDIFTIATGFVLRLFAGSSVIGTPLSMWIIIVTFLLALFLALAKRRDDVLLSLQGKETRKNIDGYNLEFVNASMVLMSGVVVVSYILYTVSEEVMNRLHTNYLYLTTFFVILGIIRYMQITFVEEDSGSPTKIVIKDRFLQITIVMWLVSFYTIANWSYIF